MNSQIKTHWDTAKQLSNLAIPLVTAQLAHMGMQVVDTLMLGQLGLQALAVGALGGVILYNVSVFFIGLLSAAGTLLAQASGEKNYAEMSRVFNQSIFLALILSAFVIFIVFKIPDLLVYFHLEAALIESTKVFLSALCWGAPAALLFFVLRDYVAVLGSPKIIMAISIASIPINAILNYLLMYGKLGLPALGIAGVGYSTSIVRWGMLLGLIAYIAWHKRLHTHLTFNFKALFEFSRMKKILVLGFPSGLMMGLEIGMFSCVTMMMGGFGVAALAAHQVAIQCANIVFTFPLGISQAANIQIGKAIGANQKGLIASIAYSAIGLGSLIGVIIGLIFVISPLTITQFFIDINRPENSSVKLLVASYLGMAAILQFLDSAQVILIGALRGMSDTFVPMLLGIVAYWVCGLTSGYIFAYSYGWNGIGLWWGLCLGIGVSVALLTLRFHSLSPLPLWERPSASGEA